MLEQYNPIEDKQLQVMDNYGKVINNQIFPEITDIEIVKAYKNMLFARTADLQTVSYQRQGRIYTYPPNWGQEAIAGAVSQVIREQDWLVPAFRELGAWLAKGATLKEIFLYFMGNEDGSRFENAHHLLPVSVPIASQLTHAVGIGYAAKYKNIDEVVYAFVGDGGTSQGDFHEALNFAEVWKVPVIFIVQNNQFAISVPLKMQTASKNIAIKSLAYGMKGIKVDGNDFFAMLKALQESLAYIKQGKGPVLIEAVTYRKGAHTTSDDPTKYRTKEEEEFWDKTDPLKRLKLYLESKSLWDDKKELQAMDEYKAEIERQFVEAESYQAYKLDDVFDYTYVELPESLKLQKMEYQKFLKWKESIK